MAYFKCTISCCPEGLGRLRYLPGDITLNSKCFTYVVFSGCVVLRVQGCAPLLNSIGASGARGDYINIGSRC
jgi:hypothetical protein